MRIVLTGGPGGGKTTALDLFRRELGDRIAIVAEAATLLFSAGFPKSKDPQILEVTQEAIYHLQVSLERIVTSQFPKRVVICDRGTPDGAGYWPDSPDAFFRKINSTKDAELRRYDHVLFFESAAAGGYGIASGNPIRSENLKEAAALDKRLYQVWQHHASFHFIPHNPSFIEKVNQGLRVLDNLVAANLNKPLL